MRGSTGNRGSYRKKLLFGTMVATQIIRGIIMSSLFKWFKNIWGGAARTGVESNSEAKFFERGFSLLKKKKYHDAEHVFNNILLQDKSIKSFDDFNKKLKSSQSPVEIALLTRKAMLCIGTTYAMQYKTEYVDTTDLSTRQRSIFLGTPNASQGKLKLAEEYFLNAAYSCQNAEIHFLAGKFYLVVGAEPDTAIAHLKKAIELDLSIFPKCNEALEQYFQSQAIYRYPIDLITGCLEAWPDAEEQEKLQLKVKNKATTIDMQFVDGLLMFLNEFDPADIPVQLPTEMLDIFQQVSPFSKIGK